MERLKQQSFLLKAALAFCVPFGVAACADLSVSEEISDSVIINTPTKSVPGTLLVRVAPGYGARFGVNGMSVEPLFLGETLDAAEWLLVTFDANMPLEHAAHAVSAVDGVRHIQYNKVLSRPETKSDAFQPNSGPIFSLNENAGVKLFNDPQLSEQWNLINVGNTDYSKYTVAGADAGVKDAWSLTAGDPSIVVAIVDQGIMHTHPDLAANMWINEAEANGKEGVDDDNNGYIDDIYGYNFAANSPEICWKHAKDDGHGTHVAGIVAAVNNNGEGVCGVAGGTGKGDGVRLMSCQIFDDGKSSSAVLARALRYAADNGAVIAQCSLGYDIKDFSTEEEYKSKCAAEYAGITYFLDKRNCKSSVIDGNIIVFSAGNEGLSQSAFPGGLSEVISVTAFGPGFQPAGYSNFGPGCNIAAPGGDYYVGRSGVNRKCEILSTMFDSDKNPIYWWQEGTSMACPHVSGVAALGLSYAHKLGLKFSREEFISMLLTSTVGIDKYCVGTKPKTSTQTMNLADYVGKMGTGAVNAWKFLMQIEGTPSVQIVLGGDSIDLASAIGDSGLVLSDYSVEMDSKYKESMGVTGDLNVIDGVLTINCTRVGSGKLTIYAKSEGLDITKEISVIARPAKSLSGGWL